jgi:hypothetical protein
MFPVAPSQRTYVHLACGQPTTVDGEDYKMLCDPFTGPFGVSTMCVHCGTQDRLERFIWADTRESLADYHKRLRSTLSPFYVVRRRLALFGCLVVVPAALAYLGARLVPSYPIVMGIVGAVAGLLIGAIAYGGYLGMNETDFHR